MLHIYIFLEKSKKCQVELLLTDINFDYNNNNVIKYFSESKNIKIIDLLDIFKSNLNSTIVAFIF